MTAFFIVLLLLMCCIMLGGSLLQKSNPDTEIDERQYYTEDGYHIYYDRKILRRLREGQKGKTDTEETPQAQQKM